MDVKLDKTSLISYFKDPSHFSEVIDSINFFCEEFKAKKSVKVNKKTNMPYPCTDCVVPLSIDKNPQKLHLRAGSSHGELYLKQSFNMGKMSQEEKEQFLLCQQVLFLEDGYLELYTKGYAQYVEVAVDISDVEFGTVVAIDTRARTCYTGFEKNGTLYLAGKGSPRQITIYDKEKELNKGKAKTGERLRVEAKLSPKHIRISHLGEIQNPFLSLIMAPREKVWETSSLHPCWSEFRKAIKNNGNAQSMYLSFNTKERKTVVSVLNSIKFSWWDAEMAWENGKSAMKILNPL